MLSIFIKYICISLYIYIIFWIPILLIQNVKCVAPIVLILFLTSVIMSKKLFTFSMLCKINLQRFKPRQFVNCKFTGSQLYASCDVPSKLFKYKPLSPLCIKPSTLSAKLSVIYGLM